MLAAASTLVTTLTAATSLKLWSRLLPTQGANRPRQGGHPLSANALLICRVQIAPSMSPSPGYPPSYSYALLLAPHLCRHSFSLGVAARVGGNQQKRAHPPPYFFSASHLRLSARPLHLPPQLLIWDAANEGGNRKRRAHPPPCFFAFTCVFFCLRVHRAGNPRDDLEGFILAVYPRPITKGAVV